MNQIYKVVWNKAKNAYVVVSELAKNRTKGCSTKKLLAVLAATGVISIGIPHNVEAYIEISGNTTQTVVVNSHVFGIDETVELYYVTNTSNNAAFAYSADGIAIGQKSRSDGDHAIALGTESKTEGESAVAIGKSAYASKEGTAVGHYARAMTHSVAIGDSTYANTGESVAIGYDTYAVNQNTIAIGHSAMSVAENSMAIGTKSEVWGGYSIGIGTDTLIYGESSIAIGKNANVGYANTILRNDIDYAVAIGDSTNVQATGGVALGYKSEANTQAGQLGYSLAGIDHSADTTGTWKSTAAAVSIGAEAYDYVDEDTQETVHVDAVTRQIINVAAGKEDTDAVNVAQLKEAVGGVAEHHYYSVNSSETGTGSNYNNDGATGDDALAVGVGASATADNATALGANAQATVKSSVALGSGSVAKTAAEQVGVDVSGTERSTDTTGTWKSTAAAISVGAAAYDYTDEDTQKTVHVDAVTRQITNVAAGTQDTDAVNVAQLKAARVQVEPGTNVTVGKAAIDEDGGVKYTVSLSNTIDLTSAGSITIGNTLLNSSGLTITNGPSVTSSGINAGNLKITNVKAGESETDAATVGQLTKVTSGKNTVATNTGTTANPSYTVDAWDTTVAADGNGYVKVAENNNDSNMTRAYTVSVDIAKLKEVIDSDTKYSAQGDSNITVDTAKNADEGTTEFTVKLNKDVNLGADGSLTAGNTTIDSSGITTNKVTADSAIIGGNTTINKDGITSNSISVDGVVINSDGINAGSKKITNVADGVADNDAVNVSQLKAVEAAAKAHNTVKDGENVTVQSTTKKTKDGIEYTEYTINAKDTITAVTKADEYITVEEKISGDNRTYSVGINTDKVATKEDGMTFTGDSGATTKKLNETLAIHGDGQNITTSVENGAVNITLSNNLDLGSNGSVAIGGTTIANNNITMGDTKITNSSVTTSEVNVGDTVTINSEGINAGDTKITNVKAGEVDTDAANYGQLKQTQNQVDKNSQAIGKLDRRVNKVGAGAAALAALHPLDFDPDDKLTFSAGIGNYRDETAGAVGMFFRPDEKVLFSLGATVGNDDNMVNAGVSFSLDPTVRTTGSKAAMAREIMDLREENKEIKRQLAQVLSLLEANGLENKDVDGNVSQASGH